MIPFLIALPVFALSGLGLTLWLRRRQAAGQAPAAQAAERSAAQLS